MEKIALVTGGGTGIGREISIALANAGYTVAIHYNSSQQEAQEILDIIRNNGGKGALVQADLSEKDGYRTMFERFDGLFDRLDVFINNSGITKGIPILEYDEETFDLLCTVNWRAAYFGVQYAAKRMIACKSAGSIVLITSNHHLVAFPGGSAYGSMKEMLEKFGKHAAYELAPYKIRVNCIAPGQTHNYKPRQQGRFESSLPGIPLRRWGMPEEVAAAVVFLCSDAAIFTTGASLTMDGGASLITAMQQGKP